MQPEYSLEYFTVAERAGTVCGSDHTTYPSLSSSSTTQFLCEASVTDLTNSLPRIIYRPPNRGCYALFFNSAIRRNLQCGVVGGPLEIPPQAKPTACDSLALQEQLATT